MTRRGRPSLNLSSEERRERRREQLARSQRNRRALNRLTSGQDAKFPTSMHTEIFLDHNLLSSTTFPVCQDAEQGLVDLEILSGMAKNEVTMPGSSPASHSFHFTMSEAQADCLDTGGVSPEPALSDYSESPSRWLDDVLYPPFTPISCDVDSHKANGDDENLRSIENWNEIPAILDDQSWDELNLKSLTGSMSNSFDSPRPSIAQNRLNDSQTLESWILNPAMHQIPLHDSKTIPSHVLLDQSTDASCHFHDKKAEQSCCMDHGRRHKSQISEQLCCLNHGRMQKSQHYHSSSNQWICEHGGCSPIMTTFSQVQNPYKARLGRAQLALHLALQISGASIADVMAILPYSGCSEKLGIKVASKNQNCTQD